MKLNIIFLSTLISLVLTTAPMDTTPTSNNNNNNNNEKIAKELWTKYDKLNVRCMDILKDVGSSNPKYNDDKRLALFNEMYLLQEQAIDYNVNGLINPIRFQTNLLRTIFNITTENRLYTCEGITYNLMEKKHFLGKRKFLDFNDPNNQ